MPYNNYYISFRYHWILIKQSFSITRNYIWLLVSDNVLDKANQREEKKERMEKDTKKHGSLKWSSLVLIAFAFL